MDASQNKFLAAAANWQPSYIASAEECARLPSSRIRGRCCEPLLVEGDTVYLDPTRSPKEFDLVSFALSERFAAEQNSNLPAGQPPAVPGGGWIKMLQRLGDIDMLAEAYGHRQTATYMTCESPDESPTLVPVVNIRRAGKFLYGESSAAQIGANAATVVAYATDSGASEVPISGGAAIFIEGKQFFSPFPTFSCAVVVTLTLNAAQHSGNNGDTQIQLVYQDYNSSGPVGPQQNSVLLVPLPIDAGDPTTGHNYQPKPLTLRYTFNHTNIFNSTGNYCQIDMYVKNTTGSTAHFYVADITWTLEFVLR